MCSLWKLGSSVVVTACRRPAPRLRVVHVDADTAAIVHHLDAIDAASVGLHALGVDDPAAGAALDPAHRVGQAVVAARAAALRACVRCDRSEEHTSELQSLMRISYAVFCLKKKHTQNHILKIRIVRYDFTNTDKSTTLPSHH